MIGKKTRRMLGVALRVVGLVTVAGLGAGAGLASAGCVPEPLDLDAQPRPEDFVNLDAGPAADGGFRVAPPFHTPASQPLPGVLTDIGRAVPEPFRGDVGVAF